MSAVERLRKNQVVSVQSYGTSHHFKVVGGYGTHLSLSACEGYALYPDVIGATAIVRYGEVMSECEVTALSLTLIGGPLAGRQVTAINCECMDGRLAYEESDSTTTIRASFQNDSERR